MAVQQVIRHFWDKIAGCQLVEWTDHMPLVQAMKGELPQNMTKLHLTCYKRLGRKNAISGLLKERVTPWQTHCPDQETCP